MTSTAHNRSPMSNDPQHIYDDIRDATQRIRDNWHADPTSNIDHSIATHTDGSRPPGNLDVMSARRSCLDDLTRIATQLVAWRKLRHTAIRRGDANALTQLIDTNADWLVSDDGPGLKEANRTTAILNRHANRLHRLANGLTTRHWYIDNGHGGCFPCPATLIDKDGYTTTDPCPGWLYAAIRDSDDVLPPVIACDGDQRHTWSPSEWKALGRRIGATSMIELPTIAEAAAEGVSQRTIQRRRRRTRETA